MSIHKHRVPTEVISRASDGMRWCFICHKHISFIRTIHAPVNKRSYYGPYLTIECERGHRDGDVFPGRIRE